MTIFISDNALQMGGPRGKHVVTINEQDSEPTYQGLIIENGMLITEELPNRLRVILVKMGDLPLGN